AVWEAEVTYWKKKLKGRVRGTELPTDRPRSAVDSVGSGLRTLVFSKETSRALKQFSHREETTLFMTLLAAFKALVFRDSGEADVLVGSSVANRNSPEVLPLIGPFTNAVPLRTDLHGDPSFRELLGRVRQTACEAYAHQALPFHQLITELRKESAVDHAQLFRLVFLFQNFLVPSWNMGGMKAKLEEFDSGMSNFDLVVAIYDKENGLAVSLKYNLELFDPGTIDALSESYRGMLQQIIKQPDIKLSGLALSNEMAARAQKIRQRVEPVTIAVTSTFTAELLEGPLAFWMRELDVPSRIEFAPYNQVFQQLLNPHSILFQNKHGANVVLVQFADWIPCHDGGKENSGREQVERNVNDLISALRHAASAFWVPAVVCICPSDETGEFHGHSEFFAAMEQTLSAGLQAVRGVCVVG